MNFIGSLWKVNHTKDLSHLEALSGERISTQQPTRPATGKWVELPGKGNTSKAPVLYTMFIIWIRIFPLINLYVIY